MPLHVDRTTIGLSAALLHEHALERAARDGAAPTADELAADSGVNVDVRVGGASAEVIDISRAEVLTRTLRADAIAQLRSVHTGLDAGRAVALLAD